MTWGRYDEWVLKLGAVLRQSFGDLSFGDYQSLAKPQCMLFTVSDPHQEQCCRVIAA